MKFLSFAILGLIMALTSSSVHAASPVETAKQIYECAYDGSRDASTWQPTGEMGIPPAGAATCIKLTDDYRCSKVIDANGAELGQGMFCGDEEQPDYPNVKAYEP